MEKWEYLTQFIWANVGNEGALDYIKQRWPEWQPKKFSPETMIPELNELGKNGWELVHMEPVKTGGSHDVDFHHGMYGYSNVYFCVFKRKILT
jgi:uncharacterized protein YbdZ (MbtH family)